MEWSEYEARKEPDVPLFMLPPNSPPPPPSLFDEVACLLTAAYLAIQNTKHNSHLWFH